MSDVVLPMSLPTAPEPPRFWGGRTAWTLVGMSAIPLWATWPLLATLSRQVPPPTSQLPTFQLLAMAFGTGALLLFACDRSRVAKVRPARGRMHWVMIAMAVVGYLASNAFYVFAMNRIPAAQANLISYLWPVMIVVMGGALGLMPVTWRQQLGVAVGLVGAALVIGGSGFTLSWMGIGLALASGLTWATFCLFRLYEGENASNVLAGGFAASAVIGVVLHLALETTVIPSASSLLFALLIGVLPLALGALAWDNGIRRGDRRLLAIMAYATPLVSALVLIVCGFAAPSIGIVLGGGLIVAAGAISAWR
jgi:drug/metabolite transporter (DMT)-like permease